ncbi:STAS domain-containing protein [Paractinoplanes maris]|uniref:STAS domain-containing protein n=1 Tax=Paractinoplanes maris TaxID=1734446 RepID=UPI00202078A7|nr:STAS domain-containing protein [Actinoplanes maris]
MTRRLIIAGELDAAGGTDLHHSVLDQLRRHQPRLIEIDARGLISLDAAGVAALLLCRGDARQMECQLTVVNPHHRTRQAFLEAGLTHRSINERAGFY